MGGGNMTTGSVTLTDCTFTGNTANGRVASVSGGFSNTAGGDSASVSGGVGNTAGGRFTVVIGGDRVTDDNPASIAPQPPFP